MLGTEKRLALLAQDILNHFDARLAAMEGKGMIVCMSRRICAELYKQIVKLRPEWHSEKGDEGEIKVVITGNAADPEALQPHIRTKKGRDAIANRQALMPPACTPCISTSP
jgi:type I restriction enzyme R subunit